MTTESPEKLHRDQEKQKRQQVKSVIGKQVIEALGQPGDVHKVQVRSLWEDHYRINVFVGLDAACLKLAHSYFLVADSEGNIIASTPPLRTKKGAKQ